MSRILPHPILSVLLMLIWCILTNSFEIGNVIVGLLVGVLLPLLTRPYWPDTGMQVRLGRLVLYVLLVIWDIIVANVEVALIVLFRPNAKMRTQWVVIPLDLKEPGAITMLAGTISLTPGTISSDLSDCGHSLLVHTLDTGDPEATARQIKTRYEARLKEVFA